MTLSRRSLMGAGLGVGLVSTTGLRSARAQAPVLRIGVLNDQSGP